MDRGLAIGKLKYGSFIQRDRYLEDLLVEIREVMALLSF